MTNNNTLPAIFTTDSFIKALVKFLNSSDSAFYYMGHRIPTAKINHCGKELIAQGKIREIPGDPYTWEIA